MGVFFFCCVFSLWLILFLNVGMLMSLIKGNCVPFLLITRFRYTSLLVLNLSQNRFTEIPKLPKSKNIVGGGGIDTESSIETAFFCETSNTSHVNTQLVHPVTPSSFLTPPPELILGFFISNFQFTPFVSYILTSCREKSSIHGKK